MKNRLHLDFWKSAVMLAFPIAMQNLLTSCASLVDTLMIMPLGDSAISAVGVAGRFTFMLNVIAFGFCSGSATLISQYWGMNDRRNIHRSYGVALSSSMILAFLYAAALRFFPSFCIGLFGPEPDVAELGVQYVKILAFAVPFMMYSLVSCAALRATEKVSVPLISSLCSVAVNVTFNYGLIGGNLGMPALGIRGAAIATLLGSAVQALIVFFFLNFGRNPVRAPLRETLGFSRRFVMKFVKTASPVLLNEVMWAIGTNIYVMILARQGTEVFAGYSVYETVQQIFFVFFVGICHASAIMVGKAVGKGDLEEGYHTAKRFLILTPVTGVVLGLILILIRNPLLSVFPFEFELSRATASGLLLFYGLWIGVRMIPYTAVCGIFRAGGDTKTGCYYEIGALYCMGIPCVFVCGMLLHIPFVYLVAVMFIAEDIPKGFLCIRHFLRRRWMTRLTS